MSGSIVNRVLLLVEDSVEDVFFLRRAFSKLNSQLSIQVVENGYEAQNYLLGAGKYSDRRYYPLPDIIVCDFKMPRTSGAEFLHWLRKQKKFERIPFVLFSGSCLPHEEKLAMDLGANIYLRKNADFQKTIEQARTIEALMNPPKPPSPIE